ncbi:hypothetical protein LINPERHAP2_LOCUS21231, partial [Linum perenne]
SDEFFFESDDIVCRCGLQAARRISRTSLNLGRKFFGCPRYEVKLAALMEKQELVRMVENLQLQVCNLQEENMQLQRYLEPPISIAMLRSAAAEVRCCDLAGDVEVWGCGNRNSWMWFTQSTPRIDSDEM